MSDWVREEYKRAEAARYASEPKLKEVNPAPKKTRCRESVSIYFDECDRAYRISYSEIGSLRDETGRTDDVSDVCCRVVRETGARGAAETDVVLGHFLKVRENFRRLFR